MELEDIHRSELISITIHTCATRNFDLSFENIKDLGFEMGADKVRIACDHIIVTFSSTYQFSNFATQLKLHEFTNDIISDNL